MAFFAMVTIVFSGCFGGSGSTDPTYKVSDLQALWQENNTEHFVRFTTERSEEYPYYLGLEWDEQEDITESDLIASREELGHPGNGWFKYELKTTGTLTEIHLMDNEGAETPKVYVVSKLTDSELEYYEKDYPSSKYYFSKVVTVQ